MENHSEYVQGFKTFFTHLSYEEQYDIIVPLLMSTNEFLKWRLKCLLNSIDTPDLLTLLPSEIQLMILSLLDGSSLLKACQVSRRWNETIKDYNQLWREKCQDIGVNIEMKPTSISWQQIFLTSWKQLHLMKAGKAFKEKYVPLQNSTKAVKAVDYNDGYLCTVTEDDRINIWQLELNIPVLSFLVNQAVSCIRFRCYTTLICGHFTGILTSWDLSDMVDHFFTSYDSSPPIFSGLVEASSEFSLLKVKYKMHSAPVFSCDFSEDIQLLVSGGADEKVKFWCLRTGTLLRTLSSQSHWILRVLLTPFDHPDENVHSILTMTRDSADRYQWPSTFPDDAPPSTRHDRPWGDVDKLETTAFVKLNESNDNFITPGLQVSSRSVALVKQDLQEKQATLELLDRTSLALRASLPLSFKVRKLMALGERFALLLTVGKVLFTSTLVVLNLHTGTIIATHTIPHSKMTTPDGAQMIVGDSDWLDGLTGWKFFGENEVSTGVSESTMCDDLPDAKESNVASVQDLVTNLTEADCKFTDNAHFTEIPKDAINCESPLGANTAQGSKSVSQCRSLVLAAGLPSEQGRVFTLWWALNEESKKKVD